MSLPDEIALFPLPNVVLFPTVDLPLHIFEPRYREMVRDAMAGDRLIGMVLLRGDWRRNYDGAPEIYPVGCVGRIEKFDLLPDGRSNLILRGVERFELVDELPGRAYRRARVRWSPAARAEGTPELRARLKRGALGLLGRADRERAETVWAGLPVEWEKLVNLLAFGLPLSELEKLALLECCEIDRRAERLIEVIDFRLAEEACHAGRGAGGEEPKH